MNHLEFAASESAALFPSRWEVWVNRVQHAVGFSIDANQEEHGFSLDVARDANRSRATVGEYARVIRHAVIGCLEEAGFDLQPGVPGGWRGELSTAELHERPLDLEARLEASRR